MKPVDTLTRVPFPEAGEGVSLAFRVSGVRELYKMYGDSWFSYAINASIAMNPEVLDIILQHSAEKNGKPVELGKITFDGVAISKITLHDLQMKLLDSFTYGVKGMSWKDHLAEIDEEHRKRLAGEVEEEGGNPFPVPADGSVGSSEPPTVSDSSPPSSKA